MAPLGGLTHRTIDASNPKDQREQACLKLVDGIMPVRNRGDQLKSPQDVPDSASAWRKEAPHLA
ncbi:hypothetical protein ACFVFJ_44815 [Streptomyces sp. NPDC057717]|uniref:hypothetical protein n=1 Tax=Streptomyces sp. NPDC057717 TaxID=3346224 RepID=UPI0036957967